MLRPVCLLPAAQLTPPRGLLTPRSGTEVSLSYLGPATRRTDAYRDGTCTRGKSAASSGRTFPQGRKNIRRVTTHHLQTLSARFPTLQLRFHLFGGKRVPAVSPVDEVQVVPVVRSD